MRYGLQKVMLVDHKSLKTISFEDRIYSKDNMRKKDFNLMFLSVFHLLHKYIGNTVPDF